MSHPLVSVCLPTYNGRDYLRECIDSIRSQSFTDFEVVMCDDQSTDGTLELAGELAAGDPRFRIMLNPRRLGLVGNWNQCVRQARGEWIKFMFQDDLMAPSCVEKLLLACQQTARPFAFCARDFIFARETNQEPFLAHQACLDAAYHGQASIGADEAARVIARQPCANHAGEPIVTLIRKSLFDRLGYFDEALIQLCDAEFWARVMSNTGAAWVPEKLATFRIHEKATTAANHASRSFRMEVLDPLVMLARLVFDRHYKRFRSLKAPGKTVFSLRKDCATAAWHAKRLACGANASPGEDGAGQLAGEWRAVVSRYPLLRLLAGIGWAMDCGRPVKRMAARFLRKPVAGEGHSPFKR